MLRMHTATYFQKNSETSHINYNRKYFVTHFNNKIPVVLEMYTKSSKLVSPPTFFDKLCSTNNLFLYTSKKIDAKTSVHVFLYDWNIGIPKIWFSIAPE